MSRAAALYHLQAVDLKLDTHRRRLAQLTAQMAEPDAVRIARTTVAEAQHTLSEWEKRQHLLEGELSVLAAKQAEVEARLYGGKVRNPKELGDLQKETEAFTRRRRTLEDEALNAMLAVEETRAASTATQAALDLTEEQWRMALSALEHEYERVTHAAAALEEERTIRASVVPAEDLALYTSLRKRKGGQAVGVLRDGICGACGVAPSASRVAGARSEDTLVRCGMCERILYADRSRFITDEEL